MSGRTRIKICCIQSVEEAAMAVAHGVDALGLVGEMPNGPGVIPPARIEEVAAAVAPPTSRVLLTSEVTANGISAQARRAGVDTVQLCDRVDPGVHVQLGRTLPSVRRMQVVHVEGPDSVPEAEAMAPVAHALLLDSGSLQPGAKTLGGTGSVHDWRLSAEIVARVDVPVFLAGGLRPENVAQAIRAVRPFGVDVCSGLRIDGVLQWDRLAAFVDAVAAADCG